MAAWHHQLDGRELSKLSEMVKDRETGHAAVHGVTTEQHEQLNNNKKGFPGVSVCSVQLSHSVMSHFL